MDLGRSIFNHFRQLSPALPSAFPFTLIRHLFHCSFGLSLHMGDTGEPSNYTDESLAKPPEKKKTANVSWSEAEDAKLVEVLLEEQANGQQAESGWKKAVWTKVIQALHQESPDSKNKTADKAKMRFDRLKGEYKAVKDLRDQSGFGWDDGKQRVTAPESVWEPLIEAKSPLAKWKDKSFPLFDDMAKLCRDVIATGDNVFRTRTLTESSQGTQGSGWMDGSEWNECGQNNSDIEEVSKPETPALKKRPYRAISPEDTSRKKRNSRVSGANAIITLANTIHKVSAQFGSPEGDLDASPLRRTRAYQVAEEEEGLSDHELVTVMKVFQNSTTHADAYLAFKCKAARKLWLQSVMDEMSLE
ncbi:hypothetical protein M422DRAFT_267492 [Sphaerobolus stellatus SS14]|uniref:Myb/SANT-like domain-containing protein n=1 Tax=Sphaerobolus stellatus (strain SS14) TaxID=990650 RepID=A0A0C9TLW7_SPHS4|nr:hypothetical protein M422DRAFT_267492 [Sphaerobolus stellatus SS14]